MYLIIQNKTGRNNNNKSFSLGQRTFCIVRLSSILWLCLVVVTGRLDCFLCVCVCVCVYACMLCMFAYVSLCTYLYIYICACLCVCAWWVCGCVGVCVFVCVCLCVCICGVLLRALYFC